MAAQRCPARWAVDVEDVGEFAGDQADVGLRPAPPPLGQLDRVAGGVLEAVGGQRVLADGPTNRVAARAVHSLLLGAGCWEGMMQGEDAVAEAGVRHCGSAEPVGWPHQGSPLEVPLPRAGWPVRNSRSSSRP
jgi:hypothetical protein